MTPMAPFRHSFLNPLRLHSGHGHPLLHCGHVLCTLRKIDRDGCSMTVQFDVYWPSVAAAINGASIGEVFEQKLRMHCGFE